MIMISLLFNSFPYFMTFIFYFHRPEYISNLSTVFCSVNRRLICSARVNSIYPTKLDDSQSNHNKTNNEYVIVYVELNEQSR